MNDNFNFLKNIKIFSLLKQDEINKFQNNLKKVNINKNKYLFIEGEKGSELFIVKSGKMTVCIELPDSSERVIASFLPGDFFGEMSIFENAPRSASCRADEDSVLFSYHQDEFFKLMEKNPDIAIKIMYKMLNITTHRLQQSSKFLLDMVHWGEDARKRAITDKLTGVYNRRFLDDSLVDQFRIAKKKKKKLSLMMVDLDYFREINELYGADIGDKSILEVVKVFKKYFSKDDIIARYGGDEFSVILPGTNLDKAEKLAEKIRNEVALLDFLEGLNGEIKRITLSIGISSYPEYAGDIIRLKDLADRALYKSKVKGRNKVVCIRQKYGVKKIIHSIREKNIIINNIIDAMINRNSFLLMGHKNPDEDCIASMVALALILNKFYKDAKIYIETKVHEHFLYLLNICKYNSIKVINSRKLKDEIVDTLIICDTPKYKMIDKNKHIDNFFEDVDVLKIEIDHHLGADSTYIGDDGYCLVTEASSASELVGHIVLKLSKHKNLLNEFQISEVFTRNVVLSILSGIIGDSKMGQYLKSESEKRYYQMFSRMFDDLLTNKTLKAKNFSNKNEVFSEIIRLSTDEANCYKYFIKRKKVKDSVGFVVLKEKDMQILSGQFDNDTIVSVARSIADKLAEISGKISLVAYHDFLGNNNLIQFRMRRNSKYKKYDLRNFINIFEIKNGGGHEGAIGFRVNKNHIDDLDKYILKLLKRIEIELNNTEYI